MKRLIFAFLTVSVFVLTVSVGNAQMTPKTFGIGFKGGLAYPGDPDSFNDYWKLGYNFGMLVRYNVTDMVAIELNNVYHTFEAKTSELWDVPPEYDDGDECYVLDYSVDGYDSKILGFTANAVISLPIQEGGKTNLYFSGGLGLYNLSWSDIEASLQIDCPSDSLYQADITETYDSENKFGLNTGFGVESFVSTRTSFHVGVKGHGIFTEDEATTFATLEAGVKFYFGGTQ
ncbi:MAG: outer membrane beta-barrel protein [Gemmatimonadota bacterium]|nr:MAG: outer membrane beta-barrel protein [Gemmatimonadota bacterium]